jgi:nucleoside-diphosphate-sugar epimerase
MLSIFITGASGCVGSYLVDELAADYHLYLLVRNPAKLRFDPAQCKNITIIPGDMDSIADHAELLSQMDYCIHAATAWGAAGTERINVERVHQLFNFLNPDRLRRVIYFSTASILGPDNQVLPEAGIYGTDYIKSKYRCYTSLADCWCQERIITVFPTLIFGGDAQHPFSNLSLSLPQLRRFSWLLGRFGMDLPFHMIHARDIAKIIRLLLELPKAESNYVLGNPPLTFGEFTRRTAWFFGHRVRWQIKISLKFVYQLAVIFGVKMSDWDRFSVQHPNFCFRTVNCAWFGLPGNYGTLEEILADWKLVSSA